MLGPGGSGWRVSVHGRDYGERLMYLVFLFVEVERWLMGCSKRRKREFDFRSLSLCVMCVVTCVCLSVCFSLGSFLELSLGSMSLEGFPFA